MKENILKIPANNDEISLYTSLREALVKTQVVEQALSHSITLKMNPNETKEIADVFLQQKQCYTLGQAVKLAVKEKLYSPTIQNQLNAFLEQTNWLIHNVICGNEEDFNAGNIRNDLLDKVHSIADKAAVIHRSIEYDLIDFCESKGRDMSKFRAALELQDQGMRIRMKS